MSKFEKICFSYFNVNKKTWEALNVYFSNKLLFEQKLFYCRPGLKLKCWTCSWHNSCWLDIFYLLIETRKSTGFKSLQANWSDINKVTPKCQMYFFDKICKIKKRYKTDKSEYHYQILHIRKSPVQKVQIPV